MKKLLQPKILIPVILSVALLVALLAFADVSKVVALMERFQKIYLLWFLLLMIAYEAIRGVQWHFLLKSMDIHVPVPTQIFSFAAGEMTKSMPIGNYFQNYLLQQSKGADFGLTSAATTIIIILEVAVSLIGVIILGLGQWTGIVRPVIIIGTALFIIAAWAYHRFHRHSRTPKWIKEHKTLLKALEEFQQFQQGASLLFHPRVLLIAALLSAGYLITAGAALYLVVRGLGIGGASLPETLAVYFFSLAFSLIIPIPVDIGVLEFSGVGALLAIGIQGGKTPAVGVMLINRVLGIGSSIAIALIVMAVFHGEFRAALRGQAGNVEQQPGTPEASPEAAGHA